MGLKSISLRDFVIVHTLDLDLKDGFTALTGETGAGKSILIDALQLVLGARIDAGVVREGALRCEISAEFETGSSLFEWLEHSGFSTNETLLLRRSVDIQGRSRAWINGSPATATQVKDIADRLVDIHGQHAWQSLTKPDTTRGLLDAYGGITTLVLSQRWQRWRLAQKSFADAQSAQRGLQREHERLTWQIDELSKLSPGLDEWTHLNAQHSRLSNAQSLRQAVQLALDALQESEQNATSLINRALAALRASEHVEPRFKALTDVLNSALAQTEDTVHSLYGYARHTELEPHHLELLDERLSLWISLARRYKHPPAQLPQLLTSWRAELQALDTATNLEKFAYFEESARNEYLQEAEKISLLRAKVAPTLAQAITQAMQGLGMQGGKFDVVLNALEHPSQHGQEHVEFLVAGHSGASPRPVGKVASGGELSRIALAIAVTTSQLGEAQTLIFDEVDSGVGGAVAKNVGMLMRQLGQHRQVMAVTHLPQVAACADQHLVVAKQSGNHHTSSTVESISGEQRVAEIARMLSGEHLSSVTLAHARELLEQ